MTAGPGRLAVLLGGAMAQLSVWLVFRPDRAGSDWSEGAGFEAWLALEAVLAVAIGLVAADRSLVRWTIIVGWGLQMAHFTAFGEHYDDPLAGLGVVVQAVLAAGAVIVALIAHRCTRGAGRSMRT